MKTLNILTAVLFALALAAFTGTNLLAALVPEHGGLVELPARAAAPKTRQPARVAHSEDWDSHYFDQNVNTSIKSPVWDYVNPLTLQYCHANPEHQSRANPPSY